MDKMVHGVRMPVVFLFILSLFGLSLAVSPPVWPAKHLVTGTLSLPYAELKEPFMAYYNADIKKSRIDYYGDTMMTIQDASAGKYGMAYKMVPMTTYKVLNERMCFQTNGTKNSTVDIQAVLPDLSDFSSAGEEIVHGLSCQVWQKVEMIGNKKNTYTMYVEAATNHPIRYEMIGFDSLLGSHYDRYYLDYNQYGGTFSDDVFKLPEGVKCGGFPGPGVEDKVLANPMREFVSGNSAHVEPMFSDFKAKHNKIYKDVLEETHRKKHFLNNVRYVHSQNRKGMSYSLAINHLADKSDDELAVLRGRQQTTGSYNGGLPFTPKYTVKDVPAYKDWRLYGAVTPVKDQAVCGSCWSFGTTGTIEGAYFLKTGQLVRLSQQELVDCSWGEGNNGCDGGEDFRAYHWIMKNGGLATEESYGHYEGIDSYCHAKNASKTAILKGFVNVTSGDLGALKVAIAQHGPISVGIDASHKSLSFYSHGVYYEPACGNTPDDLDHAVLAVGYGELDGEPYWLVKNSWSTYWGNDGYVLMSQKNNNCGVATDATYVLL